jgi:hypothetical protein
MLQSKFKIQLYNFSYSPSIIGVITSRRRIWMGHVARMEKMRNSHKILVGKSEGKRPLGKSGRRWEDIRMHLGETGWEVVDGSI